VDIRHHSIYCRRDRREVYSEIVNFEKLIVIFKDLIKD
jgi:hypothetical protein